MKYSILSWILLLVYLAAVETRFVPQSEKVRDKGIKGNSHGIIESFGKSTDVAAPSTVTEQNVNTNSPTETPSVVFPHNIDYEDFEDPVTTSLVKKPSDKSLDGLMTQVKYIAQAIESLTDQYKHNTSLTKPFVPNGLSLPINSSKTDECPNEDKAVIFVCPTCKTKWRISLNISEVVGTTKKPVECDKKVPSDLAIYPYDKVEEKLRNTIIMEAKKHRKRHKPKK